MENKELVYWVAESGILQFVSRYLYFNNSYFYNFKKVKRYVFLLLLHSVVFLLSLLTDFLKFVYETDKNFEKEKKTLSSRNIRGVNILFSGKVKFLTHRGSWRRDLSQRQVLSVTQEDVACLQHFVPATYPAKFDMLNSVQHVAGAKLPTDFVLHELKIIRTNKGTCCSNMSHVVTCTGYIFMCVYAMWLSRCYCPSYTSLQHFPYEWITYDFVAATCRCDILLRHDPRVLETL